MGNHEEAVITGRQGLTETDSVKKDLSKEDEKKYIKWMKRLERNYSIDNLIFCHAGIDEEAEDLWKVGTPENEFIEKVPPTLGHFYMDIIAGHTGTSTISGNPDFHRVFFDGESHYYIDGSTVSSGILPVLIYDIVTGKYTELVKDGVNYREMGLYRTYTA